MEPADIDHEQRRVLLDLFTEIAILEHLIRNWLGQHQKDVLAAAEFGAINYFCRLNKPEARVSTMAFSFEVPVEAMRATVDTLAGRGLLTVDAGDDPLVRVTEAGRAEHERAVLAVVPVVQEVVSLLDPEHVRITAATLQELRRTIDNLPDR